MKIKFTTDRNNGKMGCIHSAPTYSAQRFVGTPGQFNKSQFFNNIPSYYFVPSVHNKNSSYNGKHIPPTITTLIVEDASHLKCLSEIPSTINTMYFRKRWMNFNVSEYLHVNNYHFILNQSEKTHNVSFDNVSDFNSYIASENHVNGLTSHNVGGNYKLCGQLPYNSRITLHMFKSDDYPEYVMSGKIGDEE